MRVACHVRGIDISNSAALASHTLCPPNWPYNCPLSTGDNSALALQLMKERVKVHGKAVRRHPPCGRGLRKLLAARSHADLFCVSLKGEHDHALERLVLDGHGDGAHGYRYYLKLLQTARPSLDTPRDHEAWTLWAQKLLKAFDAFQLLCAVRKGPWGVEGLNQRITAALLRARLIDSDQQWYEGRPVLMTRNDYGLGLMNGDIGIALKLPESDGGPQVLRVAFPRNDGQGGVRFVLPSRLNDVETVYAMTVHKSQGSEFTHTALILPDALNPVLTKELIYTGITRAKDWFSLIEPRGGVFEEAARRKVKRLSGLMLELGT